MTKQKNKPTDEVQEEVQASSAPVTPPIDPDIAQAPAADVARPNPWDRATTVAPERTTVTAPPTPAQQQGFVGQETDQTPNSNYSVDGVTSGAPTPETDAEQAKKATGA